MKETHMRILVAASEPHIKTNLSCAWLCAHSKYGYYKPIRQFKDNDYRIVHNLSPHTRLFKSQFLVTQKQLGQAIPLKSIQSPSVDNIILDSPAHLMSSINTNECVIDLIQHFNAHLILVISSIPGSINRTLFNIEAVQQRKLPLIGIIVNGNISSHMQHAIEYFGQVQILAKLPDSDHFSLSNLNQIPLPSYLQKQMKNTSKDFFHH